jgi:hypothetical protein
VRHREPFSQKSSTRTRREGEIGVSAWYPLLSPRHGPSLYKMAVQNGDPEMLGFITSLLPLSVSPFHVMTKLGQRL